MAAVIIHSDFGAQEEAPILILACNSSSRVFLMMCSAYRLNKQDDSRQPSRIPFSILNQSVVPYRVLSVASWPAYRFLRRKVRWSGIPISKSFPQFVPFPGDLSNPAIKPVSPEFQVDFLPSEPLGKPSLSKVAQYTGLERQREGGEVGKLFLNSSSLF